MTRVWGCNSRHGRASWHPRDLSGPFTRPQRYSGPNVDPNANSSEARTTELYRDTMARDDDVAARNAAAQKAYQEEMSRYRAAQDKFEQDRAAQAVAVEKARQAQDAYQREMEAYRQATAKRKN